jgi:16S rRNA (cytosine967-C5)-methyltransferase
MKIFRQNHLLQILCSWEREYSPLDFFLSTYFKKHKCLGSHDRKEIAETIFRLIRFKGLLDQFIPSPKSWEKRLAALQTISLNPSDHKDLPAHIRVSFPKFLFDLLLKGYGEENALSLCSILNQKAPQVIRANTHLISREALIAKWKDTFQVTACKQSDVGIQFLQRTSLFHLDDFKKGLFEMQDEGSQLIASEVAAKPGMHVLDFCAGSGGKSLAFAPQMNGSGQIYLHDIRDSILHQAKKRFKRAQIQNVQFIPYKHKNLKRLKGKMDIILLDVPCSGTGTLRRNPEQKWHFTPEKLERLIQTQREICHEAIQYLKPGGKLIFATCSVLQEENEDQVVYITSNLPLTLVKEPTHLFPRENGNDGFFSATFQRNPL